MIAHVVAFALHQRFGIGSEIQRPLARVVVGGLVSSPW